MAASLSNLLTGLSQADSARLAGPVKKLQTLEIAGVFTGRELTRKDRRLSSGLTLIDRLLGAGIVRGRISEIVGPIGAGKTSLAAGFVASATRRGEAAAWIDAAGSFDPATVAAAGADLARVLWSAPRINPVSPLFQFTRIEKSPARYAAPAWNAVRAAELVLAAGGFGLVVIDLGNFARAIPPSAALRVARIAERTGAAVIVLATHRMCGTFAAQSLTLSRERACFSRAAIGAPSLFDGFAIEVRVARNKLGGVGARARWHALIDPKKPLCHSERSEESTRSDFLYRLAKAFREIASRRSLDSAALRSG